ncbi:Protein angel 1 [Podila clonocystis]|nr:Protein angel 1 [Podila clonocystis]
MDRAVDKNASNTNLSTKDAKTATKKGNTMAMCIHNRRHLTRTTRKQNGIIRTDHVHTVIIQTHTTSLREDTIGRRSQAKKRTLSGWETTPQTGGSGVLTSKKIFHVPLKQKDHFTLMTYNLLSKTLCQSHEELYSSCHPKSLNWGKRSAALLREIKSLDLDIYCFQELDEDDYTELFGPILRSRGYTGFYQRRTGDRNDGCAMFYRSQKVKAVLIRGVEYNRNQFIGRDNVGIVAILEVTQGQSKRKVCVATTHILFNPRRGMVKIAQLKMLLESAQLLIEEQDEDIPLDVDATMQAEVCMSQKMFNGSAARPSGTYPNSITEFNASFRNIRQDLAAVLGITYHPLPALQPQQDHLHTSSDVLTQMANMHIPPSTPQQQQQQRHHHHHRHHQHQQHRQHDPSSNIVSQPFQLQSAYERHAPIPGRQKKYKQWTTYHTASKQMCDFIMYGHLRSISTTTISPPSQQTPSRLEAQATLVLPCQELDNCHGMPTRYFGSDHLSLAAKFRFV